MGILNSNLVKEANDKATIKIQEAKIKDLENELKSIRDTQNGIIKRLEHEHKKTVDELRKTLREEKILNTVVKSQINEFLFEIANKYPELELMEGQKDNPYQPINKAHFTIRPETMIEILFEICRKRGLIDEFFGGIKHDSK